MCGQKTTHYTCGHIIEWDYIICDRYCLFVDYTHEYDDRKCDACRMVDRTVESRNPSRHRRHRPHRRDRRDRRWL